MAKKKKVRSQPKLFTGGLVLLVAAAGMLYVLSSSRPAYGSLSDIGQGKPVIVEVFLPT